MTFFPEREIEAVDAISHTVNSSGVRLHVLEYEGSGPPVVVIPGITSPAITWDFAVRPLADAAACFVLDLRGRGLSDHPDDYSVAACAEDVLAVVGTLGIERPVLLGHSLGARIAAVAAVRAPGVARALMLVDPPLSGPGRGRYPMSLDAFCEQLREARDGTTAAAVRRWFPDWPEAELELRARWLVTCSEEAVAQSHAGFEEEDFFKVWTQLSDPVAFVYGERSPVVTAEGLAEARALRPDATFLGVPDAGHMVPWDNLDGFLAATREVLRTVAAE